MTANQHINLYFFLLVPFSQLLVSWSLRSLTLPRLAAIFFITIFGIACDYIFVTFELIGFGESGVPFWLVCLWIWFASTFFDCYRWMQKMNTGWIVSIGAVFGPFAYWAASWISEVTIHSPIIFSLASATFWGVLFLAIFKFDRSMISLKESQNLTLAQSDSSR